MIISASKRTDIPAFYAEWFYDKISKGYVLVRNPYNSKQISRIELSPDLIDGIVFWTKDAHEFIKRINEIDRYKYYFQYTITGYGRDIEPNVPDKNEIIIPSFKEIGANKSVWRYDPIIINKKYTEEYHIRAFKKISEALEGYTDTVIISFVDEYKFIRENLIRMGLKLLSKNEMKNLAYQMRDIAASHGMVLQSCAEDLDLPLAACIDASRFGIKKSYDKNNRPYCLCSASIDIGAYNTCHNGCKYCYATNKEVIKNVSPYSDILGYPLYGDEVIRNRIK